MNSPFASNALTNGTQGSAYVPPFQLTKGQPPPIAANGGVSYMSFDQNGDAGTAAATEAAFAQIATGEGQAVMDMIENAPPGPIETRWGLGFRTYEECLEYIRAENIEAPAGGLALPLRYTVHEQPSYSIVSSNALWRDPARKADAMALRKEERDIGQRCLYFPQVLRDARRLAEYYPGLKPTSSESMDKLGLSLAYLESKCQNFYDAEEVERVFYLEIERLLLDFFPGATDALVYNHDVFNKDYEGDRTEDQENKNPGVNRGYANLVHNDLNDNSGRVSLPRVADQEPAQFRTHAALHRGRGRRQDVAAVHVDQPGQADGDRGSIPLRTVRMAFVRRPAVHHELPHLRRPRRRDHALHLSPRARVVLAPAAEIQRGLDAQVLRLGDGRLRLALVFPHGVRRPNGTRRRTVPQERRGQILRFLLARRPQTDKWSDRKWSDRQVVRPTSGQTDK